MPCLPGLCTHAADCPDKLCPGHPEGAGEGGRYWPALHAENSYSHVHTPAPVAVVKQHIAPETEPAIDFAKAIVTGACISFVIAVLACGAVAIFGG